MASGFPKKIRLEIVTPERLMFSGEVDEVTVPGIKGALGILPGHAPLLSELKIGIITYKESGDATRLYCGWGFVEVLSDQVAILAEAAETPDQIDLEQAQHEKKRAEALLRSKDHRTDYKEALRVLEQAVTRIEVAGSA
jgi:F-type H+-transporting ATPase subunit epsilon